MLIIALIMLTLMTILGAFAARMAIFQERSAGNDFERTLAQQAAETALRDAEKDILGLNTNGTACTAGCRPASAYADGLLSNGFDNVCTTGLCEGDEAAAWAPWDNVVTWATNDARSVCYGRFTSGTGACQTVAGVGTSPRYIIEKFVRFYEGVPNRTVYRITARGFGRDNQTAVTLQSVFVPQ